MARSDILYKLLSPSLEGLYAPPYFPGQTLDPKIAASTARRSRVGRASVARQNHPEHRVPIWGLILDSVVCIVIGSDIPNEARKRLSGRLCVAKVSFEKTLLAAAKARS